MPFYAVQAELAELLTRAETTLGLERTKQALAAVSRARHTRQKRAARGPLTATGAQTPKSRASDSRN